MEVRQRILVIRLFPVFDGESERVVFDRLLRSAGLALDSDARDHCVTLDAAERSRSLSVMQAKTRDMVRIKAWRERIALVLWHDASDPISDVARFTALNEYVKELREARKIILVPDLDWLRFSAMCGVRRPGAAFSVPFCWTDFLNRERREDAFLAVRFSPSYGPAEIDALADVFGTHQRIDRDDETLEIVDGKPRSIARVKSGPVSRVIEASALESGRPDPRREREDDRPTIEPPPPLAEEATSRPKR